MRRYHKIRNVDVEDCTCEQMVAYNISFSNYDWILRSGKDYKVLLKEIVDRLYKQKEFSRFNMETVYEALMNGFNEYSHYPFIATDYKRIGDTFKIRLD